MAGRSVRSVSGSTTGVVRPLRPGVFAPLVAFFHDDENQSLDLPSFSKHVVRIAQAGVGIVISGTNGEAIQLSHTERIELIRAARTALDSAGLTASPIIAGCGGGSTQESIKLCNDAAHAGADVALVIAPGYFASILNSSREALKSYFIEVAEASPLPVMIYNYPGAAGGINLDSDLITELAKEAPNTAGVKLTCGDVGKMGRICSISTSAAFAQDHPRQNPAAPFLVLGGFSDFLLPGIMVRSSGCITGLANITPRTVVKLFDSAVQAITTCSAQDLKVAQELQDIVGRADWALSKGGIAATKFTLEQHYGYGGIPRKPLPPFSSIRAEELERDLKDIIELEISLS